MARIEVGYHHGGFPCHRIRGPDRKHRLAANQRTVPRRGAGFFPRERQSSMKHGYRTDWSIPAGKEKLFSIPGNFGQNQENLSATDEHRTAWRELFSKPIAGGACCGRL